MQPQSESKIKYKILLIIPREPGGVEYHRLIAPHMHLVANYPEFELVQAKTMDGSTDEELMAEGIDIVVFNRMASFTNENTKLLMRLKKLGIITICDVDDYWYLSHSHLLREEFKQHNIPGQILESLMHSTHVTCTHELLKAQVPLVRSRKDISIIPNSINPIGQFAPVKRQPTERLQFGWVGGACHEEDIKLLGPSLKEFHASGMKATVNLCGYSFNPIYMRYEYIMSGERTSTTESYATIGSEPVGSYARIYDMLDVSMVPLNNNLFNQCKSNLKLLEAGFKKKAVICQNIHPYTSILNHGVNGLAVNTTDNKRGWFKAMQRYYKNRNMIEDHAEQLYLDVQRYHMDKVNQVRAQLYHHLISKRS